MWGIISFCVGVMGYSMSQGWADVVTSAGTGVGFAAAIYGFSNRVIKELKRENESLKSGGSADTNDSTPPEAE